MTAIVHDHKNKQIACDSRVTSGGEICTDSFDKFIKKDGDVWFFAGSLVDYSAIIEIFKGITIGRVKAPDNYISFSGFKVSKGVCYEFYYSNSNEYIIDVSKFNEGAGSGSSYALSALDFGKTAKQSIEYAKKKDTNTGGKVHVYDIVKAEFLT